MKITEDIEEYLFLVARLGSISRAAERLGISQPAISSQIKNVETQYDIELFDRSRSPLELTEEGRLFFDYLKKNRALERALDNKLTELNGLQRGELTVGSSSIMNYLLLPDIISKFSDKYPDISVRIISGSMQELADSALDGTLDLFISSPLKQKEGLTLESLLSTKIYFCVPEETEVNERLKDYQIPFDMLDSKEDHPEVSIREFADVPFIGLTPDTYLEKLLTTLLKSEHMTKEIKIQTDQSVVSYAMTLNGVGASLMGGIELLRLHSDKRPVFYMLDNKKCKRDMYIAYRKGKKLSRAAQAFVETIREVASGETPDNER